MPSELPDEPKLPAAAAEFEAGAGAAPRLPPGLAPPLPTPPEFPSVNDLLDSSRPRGGLPMRYVVAGAILILMLNLATRSLPPATRSVADAAASLLLLVCMAAIPLMFFLRLRAARREIGALVAAEELVQLRHWQQALGLLVGLLSRPTRTFQARAQALVFYCQTMMRFHRFDDVIEITEYLLDRLQLDPGAEQALKMSRAMAMLREDHLFDADRAIADLRRGPLAKTSGALALLEIYRDVKTGHPDDALAMYESRADQLREQLGHRLADVLALAARAYDLLNRPAEAAAAYGKATLLAPIVELQRRYPEITALAAKYPASPAPAEVA